MSDFNAPSTTVVTPEKIDVYVIVSGGVVRSVHASSEVNVTVVDYDNYEEMRGSYANEKEFEREQFDGRTLEEIERITRVVW